MIPFRISGKLFENDFKMLVIIKIVRDTRIQRYTLRQKVFCYQNLFKLAHLTNNLKISQIGCKV
jgi:hypothetical protein